MQNWLFVGSAYGGCRYYRQVLPIRHLGRKLMDEYNVQIKLSRDLSGLDDASVVFFSRNIGAENLSYVARLKHRGKVIVWDMDDDLSIPERWQQDDLGYVMREISALECCLDLADVITVSTEGLKKAIGRPEKTSVVPNAIDLTEWKMSTWHNINRVLYAGTPTHERDLDLVRGLFKKTCHRLDWFFFGCQPRWMGSRGTYIPLTSIRDYPRICRSLWPRWCLAPLQPDRFNESKSPIKVWEMATTGADLIASCTGPYRGHPSATVAEGEEFSTRHLGVSSSANYRAREIAQANSWQNTDGEARKKSMNVFEYVYFLAEGKRAERVVA